MMTDLPWYPQGKDIGDKTSGIVKRQLKFLTMQQNIKNKIVNQVYCHLRGEADHRITLHLEEKIAFLSKCAKSTTPFLTASVLFFIHNESGLFLSVDCFLVVSHHVEADATLRVGRQLFYISPFYSCQLIIVCYR